ncbi:hypothetical protein D3C87_1672580 [compost metagenome]
MNTLSLNKSLMQDIITALVEMEELCPELYLFIDETPQLISGSDITENGPSIIALQEYLQTLKCQLVKAGNTSKLIYNA